MALNHINFDYSDIVFGHDEPDAMWMNGQTLIEMCHSLGDDYPLDINGNKIDPSVGYVMTKKGIYRS